MIYHRVEITEIIYRYLYPEFLHFEICFSNNNVLLLKDESQFLLKKQIIEKFAGNIWLWYFWMKRL